MNRDSDTKTRKGYQVQRTQPGGQHRNVLLQTFKTAPQAIRWAESYIEKAADEGEKKVTVWVAPPQIGQPRVAHFRITERGLIEREIRK